MGQDRVGVLVPFFFRDVVTHPCVLLRDFPRSCRRTYSFYLEFLIRNLVVILEVLEGTGPFLRN